MVFSLFCLVLINRSQKGEPLDKGERVSGGILRTPYSNPRCQEAPVGLAKSIGESAPPNAEDGSAVPTAQPRVPKRPARLIARGRHPRSFAAPATLTKNYLRLAAIDGTMPT